MKTEIGKISDAQWAARKKRDYKTIPESKF
jgi:hypothetical protein